jgi:protein-disulfide isomerase
MKAAKSLFVLLILISVAACSQGNSKPSYLFKQAPKEGIAAKAGDIEVSNAELMNGIESEVFEHESKAFEVKFNKLRSVLLQKLVEKDPRKNGLSNDEFLSKYIAKDVKISDKEIDAFIKDQNIPAEHINPQVREKIKNYLEIERKKEAVDSWLADQTKKSPVEVYIPKPRRPTFPVDVGNAPFAGDKDAKVVIIEFSDFQCPFCAKGAELLKKIKEKYGKKVKVSFKQFPLPFHNHAEQAAVASLCANEQSSDLFWKMHDEMFANQETALDPEGLKKTGKKIGLKTEAFEKCLADNKYLAQVKADMEEGKKIGVKSTPTFFVNGQLVSGAQPMEVFAEIIEEELAR